MKRITIGLPDEARAIYMVVDDKDGHMWTDLQRKPEDGKHYIFDGEKWREE